MRFMLALCDAEDIVNRNVFEMLSHLHCHVKPPFELPQAFARFSSSTPNALYHRIDDGLGANRAPGSVHIDGNRLVHAANNVVAIVEHAARAGANTARHNDFRLNHLVVNLAAALQYSAQFTAPVTKKNVGVLRVARVDDAKALGVVERQERGKHLDVAAVAA